MTERERRILDRQMDRLERCVIADEKLKTRGEDIGVEEERSRRR